MSGIYWLASYPKSGNTWVRTLLTNYLSNSDEPSDINDLIGGGAFSQSLFQDVLGIDYRDLTLEQIYHYRPLIYEKMAEAASQPIFAKIHDIYEKNDVGIPIFSPKATAGAIYLVRNPLDVTISFAHHNNWSINKTIDFMNDCDAFLAKTNAGRQVPQKIKSWSEHVLSWVDNEEITVKVIRYEDLLKNTIKKFSEIVEFSKLGFDKNKIKTAVEFSGFATLKKQEIEKGFSEKQPTAASFFREGKTGSWQDKLTKTQIEKIASHHKEVMERFDYSMH